ncbi:MAG: hypothetical protein K1X83_03390 [Oligoflexia bacterium]|nr:hypothetical protein [Oligoflexia bacterium]
MPAPPVLLSASEEITALVVAKSRAVIDFYSRLSLERKIALRSGSSDPTLSRLSAEYEFCIKLGELVTADARVSSSFRQRVQPRIADGAASSSRDSIALSRLAHEINSGEFII